MYGLMLCQLSCATLLFADEGARDATKMVWMIRNKQAGFGLNPN